MSVQYMQMKSLGHALVAAQSLDEGRALARSIGADGSVYSQLEKLARPCLAEEGTNPGGRHTIVIGADAVPSLRIAARVWDRPQNPVLLIQRDVAVDDMVYQRTPVGLQVARSSLLPVVLVRDGVARELDTGEWWEREADGGFVRTNTYDARRILTGAVAHRVEDVMEAGGAPVRGSDSTDGDIVQYWSQVLQVPLAMCYEAIERRKVS